MVKSIFLPCLLWKKPLRNAPLNIHAEWNCCFNSPHITLVLRYMILINPVPHACPFHRPAPSSIPAPCGCAPCILHEMMSARNINTFKRVACISRRYWTETAPVVVPAVPYITYANSFSMWVNRASVNLDAWIRTTFQIQICVFQKKPIKLFVLCFPAVRALHSHPRRCGWAAAALKPINCSR